MVGCGCEKSLYYIVCIYCLFENTHTKVRNTTKAGNSINKHQIQLLASMSYVSFTESVESFQTRDEKATL